MGPTRKVFLTNNHTDTRIIEESIYGNSSTKIKKDLYSVGTTISVLASDYHFVLARVLDDLSEQASTDPDLYLELLSVFWFDYYDKLTPLNKIKIARGFNKDSPSRNFEDSKIDFLDELKLKSDIKNIEIDKANNIYCNDIKYSNGIIEFRKAVTNIGLGPYQKIVLSTHSGKINENKSKMLLLK